MCAQAEQKKITRAIVVFLVEYLMKEKGCSRDEAVELLLKTTTYADLMEEETELYLEPRESALDILKEELAGNPDRLLDL